MVSNSIEMLNQDISNVMESILHEITEELKDELRHYAKSLMQKTHLFSSSYSLKFGIKCALTLISTRILGKRYKK